MARRKNTKFIDPRYFMDEKTERLDEADPSVNPSALNEDQRAIQNHIAKLKDEGAIEPDHARELYRITNECGGSNQDQCMTKQDSTFVSILRSVGLMPQAH